MLFRSLLLGFLFNCVLPLKLYLVPSVALSLIHIYTIIKNLMKQFDSEGDLLNANGVAGMDVTGKGLSLIHI